MLSFLKSLLKGFGKALTWVRVFILNALFLVLLVIVIQAISSAPKPRVAKDSALFLSLEGNLVDQQSYDPSLVGSLNLNGKRPAETLVRDVVEGINLAADDDQIKGLILHLDPLQQAGMSKIEEIGQAINNFKKSGKPVVAFADIMMQHQYLLASYADEIYLHSFGGLYITGFGVYRNYYKDASDKLSLKFHVFKAGDYKDAVEPYIANGMSEASREHNGAWINSLWQRYMSIIETQRDLPRGAIEDYVDNFDTNLVEIDGYNSELAVTNKLIDGALTRIEMWEMLKEKFGTRGDGEDLNSLGLYEYLNNPLVHNEYSDNEIGLIVASGTIYGGQQPAGTIGAESLNDLIRRARDDEDLAALVIRIDSGGGSAFASEVVREELIKTREGGLPIYVSMGSVAASGGYWIASAADEIWATPATITGSIGVWSLIPNFTDSLERLGVHSDGVGTTVFADAMSPNRKMSPEVQRVFQSSVDNVYDRFLGLVAEARNSTTQDIDKIAQGRVWPGEIAMELGLVDKLGSLQDVLDAAAAANNLEDYSVNLIERELTPREQFIRMFAEQTEWLSDSVQSSLMKTLFPGTSALQESLSKDFSVLGDTNKRLNVLATCLECVEP